MIGFEVSALLPHRANPQAGNAQVAQVVELASDSAQRAALKNLASLHPGALVGARNWSGWAALNS